MIIFVLCTVESLSALDVFRYSRQTRIDEPENDATTFMHQHSLYRLFRSKIDLRHLHGTLQNIFDIAGNRGLGEAICGTMKTVYWKYRIELCDWRGSYLSNSQTSFTLFNCLYELREWCLLNRLSWDMGNYKWKQWKGSWKSAHSSKNVTLEPSSPSPLSWKLPPSLGSFR